jgi:WD40 repeat protein
VNGHTSRIFACAFNPKSHHELISGGWDNAVVCWDDRQPYATRYFFGAHICGEGLDFDKPGKQVMDNPMQHNYYFIGFQPYFLILFKILNHVALFY